MPGRVAQHWQCHEKSKESGQERNCGQYGDGETPDRHDPWVLLYKTHTGYHRHYKVDVAVKQHWYRNDGIGEYTECNKGARRMSNDQKRPSSRGRGRTSI